MGRPGATSPRQPGRPPHAWLEGGHSLFDVFHAECTLLLLGPDAPTSAPFEDTVRDAVLDLRVLRLPQPALRTLYEAPLALIRPDQIVGWAASTPGVYGPCGSG